LGMPAGGAVVKGVGWWGVAKGRVGGFGQVSAVSATRREKVERFGTQRW